jgi:hypothetical protein
MLTRHRTTARGILFLILAALLATGGAATSSSAPIRTSKVPRLVFPVLGAATYTDDFGDARSQGRHDGNDLMAPRRAIALAAEAGTVKFWTTSARAGCMLYLEGVSGTEYLYVHLNNDLADGNDNRGTCVPGVAYAKGLKSGDAVTAGQPIAFVGDSGDADGIHPHLHFEVHPDGGAATSPFPYLHKARRLLFAASAGTTFTLALTGTVVATADERLQLKLDRVRSWPGGRKTEQTGQTVDVLVPPAAPIEGARARALLALPTLELLDPGSTVTVWTEPAKVTLAAQAGEKGALSAARIILKP